MFYLRAWSADVTYGHFSVWTPPPRQSSAHDAYLSWTQPAHVDVHEPLANFGQNARWAFVQRPDPHRSSDGGGGGSSVFWLLHVTDVSYENASQRTYLRHSFWNAHFFVQHVWQFQRNTIAPPSPGYYHIYDNDIIAVIILSFIIRALWIFATKVLFSDSSCHNIGWLYSRL